MKKGNILGFVVPAETALFTETSYYNEFFYEVLRGAIAAAGILKWDLRIHHRNRTKDEVNFEKKFIDEVSGIIYLSPALNKTEVSLLKAVPKPLIMASARYQGVSYVDCKNEEGAYKAVKYLLKKGHRRIMIINGKLSSSNAYERFMGFKRAMDEAKIPLNEKYVYGGNFSEDSGYHIMKEALTDLPEKSYPTAVLCVNDLMAIGAIRAIHKKSLSVPEDISVMGFDNIFISSVLSPALTTVKQPLFNLGVEAVNNLIDLVSGDKKGVQKVNLNTEIIERDTVSAPLC